MARPATSAGPLFINAKVRGRGRYFKSFVYIYIPMGEIQLYGIESCSTDKLWQVFPDRSLNTLYPCRGTVLGLSEEDVRM